MSAESGLVCSSEPRRSGTCSLLPAGCWATRCPCPGGAVRQRVNGTAEAVAEGKCKGRRSGKVISERCVTGIGRRALCPGDLKAEGPLSQLWRHFCQVSRTKAPENFGCFEDEGLCAFENHTALFIGNVAREQEAGVIHEYLTYFSAIVIVFQWKIRAYIQMHVSNFCLRLM